MLEIPQHFYTNPKATRENPIYAKPKDVREYILKHGPKLMADGELWEIQTVKYQVGLVKVYLKNVTDALYFRDNRVAGS